MRSNAKYIFLCVFVFSISIISSSGASDIGSNYPEIKHYANSQGNEPVVNLLINRVHEIKERLSNPALSKIERQILQRELELVTEMLTKTLSRSTDLRN